MRIALLGDIAPIGRFCRKEGTLAENYFSNVSSYLSSHDVVVGNLEAPLTESENAFKAKSANLKAAPINVALLEELGITHVTLANNHIGDFGLEGVEDTIRILESRGIQWFGVKGKACRIEYEDSKIALCGYCSFNTNPSRVFDGKEQLLNVLDLDVVLAEMRGNETDGFLNILASHSGLEHIHSPSSEDVQFARFLAEQFDYIYYGHHPHSIQGIEKVGNSLLCYSLGNFIFDDVYTPKDRIKPLIKLSEANKTGIIISLEIQNNTLLTHGVVPIYLDVDEMKVGENSVDVDLNSYDQLLKRACSSDYDIERNKKLENYVKSRKAARDLNWYLKRLNINSLRMLLAARENSRLYQGSFLEKLTRLEKIK